jgi:uncharacterized protein YyaL (SSP411 family)
MENTSTPNRLIKESSPYLLQHAYNPVDWYPWGNEAFEKAKSENKPILVSIGYSTCHWCHVMERESFEAQAVADFMNAHFVCIKVDREERPDVDAIYMEAVQLINNGQGGWPLNCFLTPDLRPFYGGTYFPPTSMNGRPSWMQVLQNLSNAFQNRSEDVENQANELLKYLKESNDLYKQQVVEMPDVANLCTEGELQKALEQLMQQFDTVNGGFGAAPKFPGTMGLRFCLNMGYYTENRSALRHVHFSLEKMICGGIYDQLGGGFARYTVDEAWLVPHFEKMLYDNALLIGLMADAYKLEPKAIYKKCILETVAWLKREMLAPNGAFYAALDADSEGVEGKFYVWDAAEIQTILGEDAALFGAVYDVRPDGNWEGKTILNLPVSIETFAAKRGLNLEELLAFLENCKERLLTQRATRIRPGLDDKQLLDWNAMLITGLCKAAEALEDTQLATLAEDAMTVLLNDFLLEEGTLHLLHTHKEGKSKYHAFFDDYALLIEALIALHSATCNTAYLQKAKEYSMLVINEFLDHKDHLFYFTSARQKDVLLHKKTVYDGATPSGNSTMVHNLIQLANVFPDAGFAEQAQQTWQQLKTTMLKYPSSHARWLNASFNWAFSPKELVIVGPEYKAFNQQFKQQFRPEVFTLAVATDSAEFELLKGRSNTGKTTLYLCENFTCQQPVFSLEALGL